MRLGTLARTYFLFPNSMQAICVEQCKLRAIWVELSVYDMFRMGGEGSYSGGTCCTERLF